MTLAYPLLTHDFTTPKGHRVAMTYRGNTNDWNTHNSCLNEDEYRIRDLRLSGTAIDIGGYAGSETVALLVDNPDLHVITVEPLPENVALIRLNLQANGVSDRCTLITGAVGVGEIKVYFRYTGSESDRHHAFVGNAYGNPREGVPQAVTYAGLSFASLATAPSFVKVDCEGGLWSILHEMTNVPLIAGEAEPFPLPDGTVGSRALLESILGPTHVITWGNEPGLPGDWGFWAVRR